jgi:hypothetical protein
MGQHTFSVSLPASRRKEDARERSLERPSEGASERWPSQAESEPSTAYVLEILEVLVGGGSCQGRTDSQIEGGNFSEITPQNGNETIRYCYKTGDLRVGRTMGAIFVRLNGSRKFGEIRFAIETRGQRIDRYLSAL